MSDKKVLGFGDTGGDAARGGNRPSLEPEKKPQPGETDTTRGAGTTFAFGPLEFERDARPPAVTSTHGSEFGGSMEGFGSGIIPISASSGPDALLGEAGGEAFGLWAGRPAPAISALWASASAPASRGTSGWFAGEFRSGTTSASNSFARDTRFERASDLSTYSGVSLSESPNEGFLFGGHLGRSLVGSTATKIWGAPITTDSTAAPEERWGMTPIVEHKSEAGTSNQRGWVESELTLEQQQELRRIVHSIVGEGKATGFVPFRRIFPALVASEWLQSYGFRFSLPGSATVCLEGSAEFCASLLSMLVLDACRLLDTRVRLARFVNEKLDHAMADRHRIWFPQLRKLPLRVRFAARVKDRFFILDNRANPVRVLFELGSWRDVIGKLENLDAAAVADDSNDYTLVIPTDGFDFEFVLNASDDLLRRAFMRILDESSNQLQKGVRVPVFGSMDGREQKKNLQQALYRASSSSVASEHPPKVWTVGRWISNNYMAFRVVETADLAKFKEHLQQFSPHVCVDDVFDAKQRAAELLLAKWIPLMKVDRRHYHNVQEESVWRVELARIRQRSIQAALLRFKKTYAVPSKAILKDMDELYNYRRRWFDSAVFTYEAEMTRALNVTFSTKQGLGAVDVKVLWDRLSPVILGTQKVSDVADDIPGETEKDDEAEKQERVLPLPQLSHSIRACQLMKLLMESLWGPAMDACGRSAEESMEGQKAPVQSQSTGEEWTRMRREELREAKEEHQRRSEIDEEVMRTLTQSTTSRKKRKQDPGPPRHSLED